MKKKSKNSLIGPRNDFSKITIFSMVFINKNNWKLVLTITFRNRHGSRRALVQFFVGVCRWGLPIFSLIGFHSGCISVLLFVLLLFIRGIWRVILVIPRFSKRGLRFFCLFEKCNFFGICGLFRSISGEIVSERTCVQKLDRIGEDFSELWSKQVFNCFY